MAETAYLTVDDVLGLYAALFGGTVAQAADQLRSRDGLESALARPRQHAHYQAADLALQAAVLAHGVAEGQVFVDGNKRVALIALADFLDRNGSTLTAPQAERAAWILAFSEGTSPEEIAEYLRAGMASR